MNPLLQIPVDKVNGHRLTPDMAVAFLWFIYTDRMPLEAKVDILYAGKDEFLRNCRKQYSQFGLKTEHFETLWRRLNKHIPHVSMALSRYQNN